MNKMDNEVCKQNNRLHKILIITMETIELILIDYAVN